MQAVLLAQLTFYPIAVHRMAESFLRNRNEDAVSHLLGMPEYCAYRIDRQGQTAGVSKELVYGLTAAQPLPFVQTVPIIHYFV